MAFTVSYLSMSKVGLCYGPMLGVFMMASLGLTKKASSLTLASARSAMPLRAMVSLWALLGAIMMLALQCGLETLVTDCNGWIAESDIELVTKPRDILER